MIYQERDKKTGRFVKTCGLKTVKASGKKFAKGFKEGTQEILQKIAK